MSTPAHRSMKRARETNRSEVPSKRRKHTPNLQLPRDKVREKCTLLDDELGSLFGIIPDDQSCKDGRQYIHGLRDFVMTMSIKNNHEVKRESNNLTESRVFRDTNGSCNVEGERLSCFFSIVGFLKLLSRSFIFRFLKLFRGRFFMIFLFLLLIHPK